MIERRLASLHSQYLVTAVVALALAGLLGTVLVMKSLGERRYALDVAALRTQQQAALLSDHATRSLEMVDLVLTTGATYLDPALSPTAWHDRLRRSLTVLPQIHAIQVYDPNGRLQFDTRTGTATQPAAAEAFFIAHRDKLAQFVLGAPLRQSGRWLIPLSRRMVGADGTFVGVLRALLDAAHFSELYSQGESGEADQVVLFDSDGRVYANWTPRHPFGPLGGDVADLLPQPGAGIGWHGALTFESDTLVLAQVQLADFPLTLAVARDKQAVLTAWRDNLAGTLVALTLLAVATGCFLLLTWRQTRRRSALERTLILYERALAASTDGIIITERGVEGNRPIIYTNPGFTAVTGYGFSDVAGRDPRLLHRDEADQPGLETIRQALRTEMPVQTILRDYRHDGTPFWCELMVSPVRDDKGRVTHFLGVQRDVSASRRAAQEMEQMNRLLASSNADLEQFAYVASHDLQQPLRTITSYVQLLERHYADKLDEDGRQFIAFAVDGAKRMRDQIVDLLEYSRITSRGAPFGPVDAMRLAQEVESDLAVAIAEAEAHLIIAPLPVVWGDSAQVRRLLQNLIGNAIKYRAADRPPEVRLSAIQVPGFWQFTVSDNGIGIASEHFERIFLIFQRLHTRAEYPGTGIGLAVCRKIVERHGGRLWLESTPGAGSRFMFTLPLHQDGTAGSSTPG